MVSEHRPAAPRSRNASVSAVRFRRSRMLGKLLQVARSEAPSTPAAPSQPSATALYRPYSTLGAAPQRVAVFPSPRSTISVTCFRSFRSRREPCGEGPPPMLQSRSRYASEAPAIQSHIRNRTGGKYPTVQPCACIKPCVSGGCNCLALRHCKVRGETVRYLRRTSLTVCCQGMPHLRLVPVRSPGPALSSPLLQRLDPPPVRASQRVVSRRFGNRLSDGSCSAASDCFNSDRAKQPPGGEPVR